MKKIMIAIVVSVFCGSLAAQSEFDAFKYSKTDINGTARYMGMAGAFGALGGDASAVKDNPAGLGIYRKSELSTTLDLMVQKNTANWHNRYSENGDNYKLAFNNLSFVLANSTWRDADSKGLISSNWSFSFNRLKNFNRSIGIQSNSSSASITDYMACFTNGKAFEADMKDAASPYNNLPWISVLGYNGFLIDPDANNGTNKGWVSALGNNQTVTPSFYLTEKGGINEYAISWAGNFGNKIYIGAGLNFQRLDYTGISTYGEAFDPNYPQTLDINLKSYVTSTGNGVNVNLGIIARPIDALRLGLAFHSPTFYKIDDHYYSELNTRFYNATIRTPEDGNNSFQLQTPLQYNLSAAYSFGKTAVVSMEYVSANYGNAKLKDADGQQNTYQYENDHLVTNFNKTSTIKLGGEYKVNSNFSVRAGFATTSRSVNNDAKLVMFPNTIRTDAAYLIHKSTQYLTAGFGYRESDWFIDFALLHKTENEDLYPFFDATLDSSRLPKAADVKTITNNLVVTLGFKF